MSLWQKALMDLKAYYKKLRETEAALPAEVILVCAGQFTEAPRAIAARMIVEGSAELASDADAAKFCEQVHEQYIEEQRRRAAASIQVSVITEEQARAIARPKIKPERSN